MNYVEATEWLFNIRRFGAERTLDPIIRLMELLGNPHKKLKYIHVTGTNGKGSTSAMIAAILRSAGYKVGLFTSPHLIDFSERIVINEKPIPHEDVVRLANFIKPKVEALNDEPEIVRPLFFDIVTAMAFVYFFEQKIDFAVMEVGMGGRLDATNIIDPLVSVITNVSLEHTEVLGDTIIKIATEKAGIIKKRRVLVTGTQDSEVYELFKKICQELDTLFYHVGTDITYTTISSDLDFQNFLVKDEWETYHIKLPLLGSHQLINASMAIGAVSALRKYSIIIHKNKIESGLQTVKWPGRMDVMQRHPLVILDSAKDEAAVKTLAKNVTEIKHKKLILILSISSDKRIYEMMSHLIPVTDYFILTMHSVMGRAAKPSTMIQILESSNKPYEVKQNVSEAITKALELVTKDDMILITGSVFLVGEALLYYKK
ncbi:bifunctional folylpolyglutamate synthase/dihydrofolate synthase [Candidatus Bathyarchaeota archaeon]|nr:bifunctional folylpolyglutamate synthase/dihydrofolate synthase [Candidatus Bathyarchaeota archaeon]